MNIKQIATVVALSLMGTMQMNSVWADGVFDVLGDVAGILGDAEGLSDRHTGKAVSAKKKMDPEKVTLTPNYFKRVGSVSKIYRFLRNRKLSNAFEFSELIHTSGHLMLDNEAYYKESNLTSVDKKLRTITNRGAKIRPENFFIGSKPTYDKVTANTNNLAVEKYNEAMDLFEQIGSRKFKNLFTRQKLSQFVTAVKEGDVTEIVNMGSDAKNRVVNYMTSLLEEKNPEKALKSLLFERASNLLVEVERHLKSIVTKSAVASYNLALVYMRQESNHGHKGELGEYIMEYLRKPASKGFAPAAFTYAYLNRKGIFSPKNYGLAESLFEMIENVDPRAPFMK
ncbi:MAG: hypothetical protein HOI80_00170, partial [Alphaproteobacteria bacterium]|nr:hypothetical protein [Alphaproteobacteria bacterium]